MAESLGAELGSRKVFWLLVQRLGYELGMLKERLLGILLELWLELKMEKY